MATQKALRNFDVPKAIAAIGMFVKGTGETLYPIMKMMYLADKRHLHEYGRFIVGDEYCAMAQGPVPSLSYDMLKRAKVGTPKGDALDAAIDFFDYLADHHIALKQEPDLEELSVSELNCIQAIIDAYRNVGKWAVKDLSHDEAWRLAWANKPTQAKRGGYIEPKSIAETLEGGDRLIRHLIDAHPGEAKLRHG
ncbi:Panacea domain-containing protein [Stenotrophomonas sp. GD03777]|uniref:Panacea domain-containing protein n=1 Tax=Stenotrophomonas TaxID=40323 RepID=UPI00244AE3D8|nr:Panacea domain-containing protein [Stenotrophomonas sp. GD03777]MDH1660609.1 Panacea domain-containing protein [Stenotrophomonas sp. GD03777]